MTGWLAFDVGARRHAYAARINGKEETGQVDNTPEAIGHFLARQQARCGQLRVVMEATGIYYLDLAVQLAQTGVEVMVVNPKAAHHFAKAMSQRSKTDALDARMLLAYLQRMDFVPGQPPAPQVLELRQLGRHLSRLAEQKVRLKNQLHALHSTATSPQVVIEDMQDALAMLERRIERLSADAMARVRADAALAEPFDALDSIIGVGPVSALALLAELLVLPREMNSRACVCHAGLDVRIHRSGSSVELVPRLSKHGNKYLRHALYMPAMTAIVHDPHAKAFRDRLLARGKKKMQALAAVMRKLLTAAWALLRNPQNYDGAKLFASLNP